MNTTTGFAALDNLLRQANTLPPQVDATLALQARIGGSAGQPRDAAGERFMQRAMQFGRDTRAQPERDFFSGFRSPQRGAGADIRVSIGLFPAPQPVRPQPPVFSPPPQAPSNPSNARTTITNDGRAMFENDNYIITAGDDDTVTINNKATGTTYQAWGDPHFSVNGEHQFDFWGTTSFELDDGTKVTIDTVDAGNNMTLSSKVTITNGDYGVQMKGVDSTKTGDLAYREFQGRGEELDAAVRDGIVLQENAAGNDMVTTDRNGVEFDVDQAYMNGVDELKTLGRASENIDNFEELQPEAWPTLLFGDAGADNGWSFGGSPWQGAGAGMGGIGDWGGFGGMGAFAGFGGLGGMGGMGGTGGMGGMGGLGGLGGQGAMSRMPWWSDPSVFESRFPTRQQTLGIDLGVRTDGWNTQMVLAMNLARQVSADINLRVWG